MSSIKLEITIDSTQFHLLGPIGELLGAKHITTAAPGVINISAGHVNEIPVQVEEVKAPATRTRKKPEPAAKIELPKAEEPETEEPETEESEDDEDAAEEDADDVTIEDVKAVLAKKVAGNRDAIVKKLKALGAAKVSELDPKDYKDMHDFMQNLK